MRQLSLFTPITTIAADPLGEPTYRFQRDSLWWDGNRFGEACRAMQVVGDNLLAVELARLGDVEVFNAGGKNVILIEYAAIANTADKGHLPIIYVNGHRKGSTYAAVGYAEAEALTMAKRMAEEEASRYVGDWEIVIREK